MFIVYMGATALGALAGFAALGGPGASLGACVAVMLASVFILNRE